MKQLILFAFLVGCASDNPFVVAAPCAQLERDVTDLRAGACVLPSTPVPPVPGAICPVIHGIRCGADGASASCPDGWDVGCDEPSPGMYVNCTYTVINSGVDQCTPVDADSVSYPAVATLQGHIGLIVVVGNSCEFRECE